ncbi:hypothetical protein [Nocardia flavorosea]|uniref:Uncharacterized protein n=1 Tax=Nocardia flavorosea TaxID=53429 RepID=A0A846YMK7_9NOCA|nr:hypothetical protein [Nocardia flavorosea]NKY58508.1 hypothetical protein [Nocardia flavorosea]
MSGIRYPDAETVDEITARYLLSMPTTLLPMLYGFRFDGESIDAECAAVDLAGERGEDEPNPIHLRAAQLRNTLGPDMFGFGLVFVVCADQLEERAENRHIPEQVRVAGRQLPGVSDLIVAVVMDAAGRQWWAVADRYLLELDPVRIHVPATAEWRIPGTLDASLWTAALALDETNHPYLLRCR